ncbi:MAG: amidohydrolase family protein [Kiritimatiellia bacterium]
MTFSNLVLDGRLVDLVIAEGRIAEIRPVAGVDGIPPTARIVVPAFYNCHTHLAMNLLRGVADDLELMPWLKGHIWPAEARLTDEIVLAGARLAMLELIRTGTVFANDMYWHAPMVARAAEEMGIRCAVSMQTIETGGVGVNDPRNTAANAALEDLPRAASSRVFTTLAPHAIYTVCERSLRAIAAKARAEDRFIHIHVAETRGEVEACRREHGGRTPIRYLLDCGILGPKTLMAHCVHLTDDDIRIIRDTGAVIVENQQSNLKLVSGLFPFARTEGCRRALGTDGASSNNALSMFAEMKCAALAAKIESGSPTTAPAGQVLHLATRGGAEAFGLDAGVVRVGAAADFLLLKPSALPLQPGFNLASDLVYAADATCLDTVVCAGRVLMAGGVVPHEEEVIAAARRAARLLI